MEENVGVLITMSGAIATLLGIFLKGLWDFIMGKHKRDLEQANHRRDSITRYKQEAHDADERANREWNKARQFAAYAHDVEQFCMREHRTTSDQFPPWPG
ncbi:hypothetical protein [Nesterenkonia sandarakina]|uniref:Uncharacterized protein n=1 Tax=Nesterenkonia sandarakina TaxID=272918 RepID=A0A2T0YIV9_9MICC|nr:hypothetical protein [Nesterenkonia sandarakina]PRZ15135.1 hypothetical protein BCL67_10956 [Nesterenkonia sandarakina]